MLTYIIFLSDLYDIYHFIEKLKQYKKIIRGAFRG